MHCYRKLEKIGGKVHITAHFIQVSPTEITVVHFFLNKDEEQGTLQTSIYQYRKDVYGQCLLSFSAPDKIPRKGRLLKPVWLVVWFIKTGNLSKCKGQIQTHWAHTHPGNKQITYGRWRCLALSKNTDIQITKSISTTRHNYPFTWKAVSHQGLPASETETHTWLGTWQIWWHIQATDNLYRQSRPSSSILPLPTDDTWRKKFSKQNV